MAGAAVAEPRLLALNEDLAIELGVDAAALGAGDGLDMLVGQVVAGARHRSPRPTPVTSSACIRPASVMAERCCSASSWTRGAAVATCT